MSIATPICNASKAAFGRIVQMLNTAAFCVEEGAVLYSKPVPGSTMTLDQWLQLNKNGELVYASRLIQQEEDHPNYPVHAEYEVVLPDDQAEALALSWLAESNLEQTVRQLRASLAAYNRDLYAA
jgi:hypothetical protein